MRANVDYGIENGLETLKKITCKVTERRFPTYLCTGSRAAARGHQTLNLAITSPTCYRYINFMCCGNVRGRSCWRRSL